MTETEQKSETKTRRSVAYFRENKERIFDDLAGAVKDMAIPQRHKITKLHNRGHKIPRRFPQADERNNTVLTLISQVAKGSDLYRADKSTKLCMVVA